MQTIDVLSHDCDDLAGFFERDDGAMDRVRRRVPITIPAFELKIPMLDSRRFRGHEVLEVNRLPASPNALRSAKIGDPAPRRNAGASENQRAVRVPQIVGEPMDALVSGVCWTARLYLLP